MLTWYKNTKTSVKLLSAFVVLALVVLGVGLLGLSRISLMSEYANSIYNDSLVMAIDLGHVNEDGVTIRMNALKMVSGLYNDELPQLLDQSNELAKKANDVLDKIANDPGLSQAERKQIGGLVDSWKAYNESRTNTMRLALARDLEKARLNARTVAGKKYDEFDKRLEEFLNTQITDGREMYENGLQAKKTATMITWAAILTSMLAAIVFGLYITSLIARPLQTMSDAAKKMAEGDLNVEIELFRRDEVGILAESFRTMSSYLKGMAVVAEEVAEGDLRSDVKPKSDRDALGNAFKKMINGLRGMVAEIRAGASQIASATTQIAATAEQSSKNNDSTAISVEETTATMHEMSANIQNVAKNSQSQASSVTETSSSIEQMVTSIQRIAGTVKQLTDISQNAKKAVDGSLDAVDKNVKGTDEINRAIMRAADTISALGSRAEDIGKIVDVIDDIAEQTNLLALNAAIEAARAGEQGMGFAVVAEEVRKLAERSVKSTKEISELITGIQKEAQEAVRQMEKSTQTVEKGVELSKKVENSLQDISGNVTEVDRYAREIGAATQEQSSGSTQIAKAAENLREVTHEITSATDEQATAAEQIVKTMEKMREMVHQNAAASVQLASSAEELSAQAERFQQIVGKFVVDDNDDNEPETQRMPARRRLIGGNGRKTAEHKELVKA